MFRYKDTMNTHRILSIHTLLMLTLLPVSAGLCQIPSPVVTHFRVAILDFKNSAPDRASDAEVLSLSALVRSVGSEILPKDSYLLMTKDNIEQMLPPGKSLTDCLGECALETARRIGADYVIEGEVVAFSTEYRATINLYETSRGILLTSMRPGAVSLLGLEDVLSVKATDMFLDMKSSIGGNPPPGGIATVPTASVAAAWSASGGALRMIQFTSDPAGAIVEIDGQLVGETPCQRAMATGVYGLSIKKIRYLAHSQALEVGPRSDPDVYAQLAPDFGMLAVTSEPVGMQVFVDGQDWGRTPCAERPVGVGIHEVIVSGPNHHADQRRVPVDRSEHASVVVALVPKNGGLIVKATDGRGNAVNARVFVDGADVGATYDTITLLGGAHDIVVYGKGRSWEGRVVVEEKMVCELPVVILAADETVGMVLIEPGVYKTTSSAGRSGGAMVTVDHVFHLSATEVTQADFQRVMGRNPSYFKGANRPVEQVTWYDAVQFCNRLSAQEGLMAAYRIVSNTVDWDKTADGYRLPTEAEWEYACRADEQIRPDSEAAEPAVDIVGWYLGNAGGESHSVASKPANARGLFDMRGNVWEWCWDPYGFRMAAQVDDILDMPAGSQRAARGGCWSADGDVCSPVARRGIAPSNALYIVGFRVARGAVK